MLNISLEIEALDYFFNFFGIFLVYLALKKEIHWYSLLLSIVCSGILALTTHYIYGGLETIILILVLATVIFSLIRFKKVKDSVIFFVLANIYVVVVYCIVRAVIYIYTFVASRCRDTSLGWNRYLVFFDIYRRPNRQISANI